MTIFILFYFISFYFVARVAICLVAAGGAVHAARACFTLSGFFAKRRQAETHVSEVSGKMGEAGGAVDLAEMLEGSESEWGSESGDKSRMGEQKDAGDVASKGLLLGGVGFENAWWRNGKMLRPSKPNDEPCDAAANAPRQGVPSMWQR